MNCQRVNLKDIDREIRQEEGGITFFVEIRGKTPFDRAALISVPMDNDNSSILKSRPSVRKALKDFASKMKAPLMYFRFYKASGVYIVRFLLGNKLHETTAKAFARGVAGPSIKLLLEKSIEVNDKTKLPPAPNSAKCYSDMHNEQLPPWCWCVDVDCFNEHGIKEVKREGEELTYNQMVLKRLVEAQNIRYEVVYV